MRLPLLHAPANITRWVLVAIGVGTDPTVEPLGEWPIYYAKEPSEPDDCITVYDTTPQEDGRLMVTGEQATHWGLTVRVRGTDEPTSAEKAHAVREAMTVLWATPPAYDVDVTIDGTTYLLEAFYKVTLLRVGEDRPNAVRFLYNLNCYTTIWRRPIG